MVFVYRLALALGRSVGELMSCMSEAEFRGWIQFYEMEPWGEDRADLRAGIVASTIANVNRRQNSPALKPMDFMPFAKQREEATPTVEKVKRAFGGLNGKPGQ